MAKVGRRRTQLCVRIKVATGGRGLPIETVSGGDPLGLLAIRKASHTQRDKVFKAQTKLWNNFWSWYVVRRVFS